MVRLKQTRHTDQSTIGWKLLVSQMSILIIIEVGDRPAGWYDALNSNEDRHLTD